MRVVRLSLALLSLAACSQEPIGPDPTTSKLTPEKGYASGSRLKARKLTGADGSEQYIGWYDSERGENCSFRVAADGVTRCLPEAREANYWLDSSCTMTPVYKAVKGGGAKLCGELPPYISVTDPCSGATTIYTGNVQLNAQSPIFVKGDTCSDFGTAGSNGISFQVGAEVAPESFAAATESKE